ncbi:MAG: DUF2585 domain-containing protein, partial [Rhizobiales bacterium]|nr:DUF2585 domain-containing protein [Hyphomicrobiales bacterium]
RTAICKCGYVKIWENEVFSSGNSQHVADWYTPSHVMHGFLFFAATWVVARHWPLGLRLVIATFLEEAWEIVENNPLIIDRYRQTTISLDYYGDSVINSTFDVLAMVAGFWLASRLPVWLSVVLGVGAELFTGYMVRDNLTLNIIMLVWPVEAIRQWQMGA